MHKKTALTIAEEVVRIWEEHPNLDWQELIGEFELMCKERSTNKEVVV